MPIQSLQGDHCSQRRPRAGTVGLRPLASGGGQRQHEDGPPVAPLATSSKRTLELTKCLGHHLRAFPLEDLLSQYENPSHRSVGAT